MLKPEDHDHVLPRPVERLPDYAPARARQALAEKLTEAFHLSDASASAIANTVVEPSEVRKSIGEPADPGVERISVPGGTLLGIRTIVWARRVMPNPGNPRTLPGRRHPFAIEPGTGAEDSRFRPLPEPRPLNPEKPNLAELAVDIESRHHVTWASQQAASYVLAENDWRASIESQGVMEAVWLVPFTFCHGDEFPPVTALVTAEGSSRTTAAHDLLGIRSADVPYDDNERELRGCIRKRNDAFERGASPAEEVLLRCERIPALILVGFEPHSKGTTEFPTAVKSLVALRHVDPPKPWGEGPENESLADEVLDELYRRSLVSATERAYYAGSCTRAEARAAHLSDDPSVRAAQTVRLLTNDDDRVKDAIRVAVTSQSTRKRITPKLLNELSTALILRAVADDPDKVDQVRRYLRVAFGKSVHIKPWQSTQRSTDELVNEALSEVRRSIGDQTVEEPGPSSLQLAVRASYPLIVTGRLNADRGSRDNDQPDRRAPSEVLEAMRRSIQGVHQLGQALRDFSDGKAIRAVDEAGNMRPLTNGPGHQTISDIYLRTEFPPPGKARAPRPGDTPADRFHNRLNTFSDAVDALSKAFQDLGSVGGDDGRPLVDTQGVDHQSCAAWRDLLREIDEELVVWSRTFRKSHGTHTDRTVRNDEPADDDTNPYAEAERAAEAGWEDGETVPDAA